MIDFSKLPDMEAIVETDDFHIARMMVEDIRGCHEDLRMWYLAIWVARLRTMYVEVGQEIAK